MRHFSTLAQQLSRLVSLHLTNEFTWMSPHRMDPDARFELLEKVAIAINGFGGTSAHGEMDGESVASLFTTLQCFVECNPLPLSALPLDALDELCKQVWSPLDDVKGEWIDGLRRLARAAAVLGSIPPSHPSAPSSHAPSSWLVWRSDKSVAPDDIVNACRTLGVPGPQAGSCTVSGSESAVLKTTVALPDSPFADSAAGNHAVFTTIAHVTMARVREVFHVVQVGPGAASSEMPLALQSEQGMPPDLQALRVGGM